MWTNSSLLHEQVIGSVESALREAFHYGEDYFNLFSSSLRDVCYKTPIREGVEGTYGVFFDHHEYFKYSRYADQFKLCSPLTYSS
jgi:hypothetical protein